MFSPRSKFLIYGTGVALTACAGKPPVASVAPRPVCTVADMSGCAPHATSPQSSNAVAPKTTYIHTPQSAPPTEIQPFFESVTESNIPEEKESPVVDQVIGEEVESEIGKADLNKVPKFDIPIVVNKQVEKWIDYFQGRGRKVFGNWLARSEKYIPMIRAILRENGLPEDLIYLAMIESGFKPYAYSPAKASGPWQFIKGTGALYGLKVNWWIDERRDPEKSTIAAAQHLKDLYDQFNSWYLAAASYNAGAGKISKAIKRYRTEDFWEMAKFPYLKAETKNYVPKMLAAALIAKDPARYNFTNITFEEPLTYDKVIISEPTELSAIAVAMGLTTSVLIELNPELKRDMTPPNYPNYELRIPKGSTQKFAEVYPTIRRASVARVVRHVVKKKETLASIAADYGLSPETVATFNRMKSRNVRRGQQLAIPLKITSTAEVRLASYRPEHPSGKKSDFYTVRSGDTLWSISRRFEVSVAEIRKWNNLDDSKLRPGARLKLYARADPPMMEPLHQGKEEWKMYRVKKGDTLSKIAKRNGVKVSDIVEWNRLDSKDPDIHAGDEIRLRSLNL